MLTPTLPANERHRLQVLEECDVLDTPPEVPFDDIARLAALVCGVPIALVSLVDAERQWFKAKVGLPVSETPREVSFCGHVVASGEMMVVPDTRDDARFSNNPLVLGDPHLRFYAGAPLVLEEGVVVGTLCVLDREPRTLNRAQLRALASLAEHVAATLRRRRANAAPRAQDATAPAAPLPAAVGEGLVEGRYQVGETLGVGGVGVVVEGRDMQTGQPVAIKFLREGLDDSEVLERFALEAQALLRVGGDRFTRVLDVGNLGDGSPYIVMERLEGEDLATCLDREGPMPAVRAVALIIEACEAIAHAHAAGILHRDLKPANLFLARRPDGSVRLKVLDFGVAKFFGSGRQLDPALTPAQNTVGTSVYMSPEQARNQRDLDGRTDVWSLGVVLYELLLGDLPFNGATTMQVFGQILSRSPPGLDALPPALASVLNRALAKSRDDRFATVSELASALASCELAPPAPAARHRVTTPAPPPEPPPASVSGLVVTVLLGLGLTLIMLELVAHG